MSNEAKPWDGLDEKTATTRLLELDLIDRIIAEPGKWKCNEEVYMAIGNKRAGAAEKLIALMRSGEEIHPIVREAIAQSLEDGSLRKRNDNVRLVVVGDGQRSHGAKIAKRQEYVKVAKHYEALMSGPEISSTDALKETADTFGAPFDVATVSASVTYYRKMLEATGHIDDVEMRAVAEHQFHLDDIDSKWRDAF